MRWFLLPCAKERCVGVAGWGPATVASRCPHRVGVVWRPDQSWLACHMDDTRYPGGGVKLCIRVRSGEDGVAKLRSALRGVAVVGWWVGWRLGWQMRRTFRRQAEMAAVRRVVVAEQRGGGAR